MGTPTTDPAFDIIVSRTDNLVLSQASRTTGSSNHASRFEGVLGLWSSFESSVRQNTKAINWSQHQTILQSRPVGTNNSLHHEHYICGDEISVSGRFVQNVLHPLIAVGKELGQEIQWGDSKTSEEGLKNTNDIPDFVALANGKHLRAVGELKTPWTVDLLDLVQNVTSDDEFWRRLGEKTANLLLFVAADRSLEWLRTSFQVYEKVQSQIRFLFNL